MKMPACLEDMDPHEIDRVKRIVSHAYQVHMGYEDARESLTAWRIEQAEQDLLEMLDIVRKIKETIDIPEKLELLNQIEAVLLEDSTLS